MKRVRLNDGFHYLNCPDDFADLIRENMGDESADLFLEIVSDVQDAQMTLTELDIEPNDVDSMSEYQLSEALDLLSNAIEW